MRYLSIFVLLLLTACARVGMPTGGPKDKTPPKLLNSVPANGTTNFKGDELILLFDEYVVLKDPSKNILISPPLQQSPTIKPLGTASKNIKLIFKEKLQPKTTYIINFGEGIADYNEGNKLKSLQLVFSTGPVIDSLSLKGKINPIHFEKKPKDILVGLYPAKDFNDSVVFTKKPFYVAMTDAAGKYEFSYLKKGDYIIRAIEDLNHNFKYTKGKEAIAFVNDTIHIPLDTIVNLNLFKEPVRPKVGKIKQVSTHHITIEYEGPKDSIKVASVIPVQQSYTIFKPKQIDYWYQTQSDSIFLNISAGNRNKEYHKKGIDIKDSLQVHLQGKLQATPLDTLQIIGNRPLVSIIEKKMILTVDSLPISFTVLSNKDYTYAVLFDKNPGKKYNMMLLPGAVTDYLSQTNKDTIKGSLKVLEANKFGNLHIQFNNKNQQPVFIEILQNNRVVRQTKTVVTDQFTIKYLSPGKYNLRFVFDDNKNNKWDTGNYLLHKYPEATYEPAVNIEIRANWDINQKFDIKR